jgi:uncharacterized protein YdiU (UPF0061 family)
MALDALVFDDRFTADLPADPDERVVSRQVPGAAYSWVRPTPVRAPTVIGYSCEVGALLGLPDDIAGDPAFAQAMVGNTLLAGSRPYAVNYGGHQFGHWAGQLGDGRAIALGEVVAAGGRWTLQLKGAGRTPYSRGADGLAVLRSSLREFLCSEAMAHLGVPTTRALSLTLTGEQVVRDMLYDGNPREEPGAVVCRVAPSFVRFGNFEIFAHRSEHDLLRRLADHVVTRHFPHLGPPGPATYMALYREVVERTADLMVDWMRVGFVHGVMNTDNLSILGLTIDYGPYGWLEDVNPGWTPNTTDAGGRRYRYGHQPAVAHWNLAQLGNALVPLVDDATALQEALDGYPERYAAGWRAAMAAKLGLRRFEDGDEPLIEDLLALQTSVETDMTIWYRLLCDLPTGGPETGPEAAGLDGALYGEPGAEHRAATQVWLDRWAERVRRDGRSDAERAEAMRAVNPRYVLRNYLAQLAIDRAEAGDYGGISELQDTLRRPYEDQPGRDHLAAKRPDWARTRVGCSMLSCSS